MIHFESITSPCKAALDRMMVEPSLEEVEQCKAALYEAMGADRFVFTASGAEAVAQVFWSTYMEVCRKEGKCHIVISQMEDAPTMQNCKRLEELGCIIKIAPVNEKGQIDVAALRELIGPRTALISVTMANGLTGVVQPVEEIVQLAKEKKVLVHLEGTFAVGKMPISFRDLGADYLTFSGDRIHSVKSSGGLFVKEGAPSVPLVLGTRETFDARSFMALGSALHQALLYLDSMNLETARLRNLLESSVAATPLFGDSLRLPNTTALVFSRAHQDAIQYYLQRKGILASIGGSYCQHLSNECAVSFSLSRMTTEDEIKRTASLLNEIALHLQTVAGAL